ncbi:unnamed protein product [Musa acuminata subsp. malaccensis]|uniref:(wild Malaysian banana) hypothetical protein n=1 Tax=Musa acuminata subsp. malaccensis TaxID=214687 RepID=A0A804KL24_MUSAM|nr:PREDICTED: GPI-anchored protein LORELEI-like [Musa acuminata subsp. malaccensis]CAG1835589.1 unnamed protein product [Musa acuminata subsp. malaccensis]
MDSSRDVWLLAAVLMYLAGLAAGSTFISDTVFELHGSAGRSLLQAKTSCPIDLEGMNSTIITGKCKGPQYPANLCCAAFKELACPFADQLNDETNDCASTMFSYINLYGKYPPGLFASECREGKEGLACPATPPESEDGNASADFTSQTLASLLTLLICAMVLVFLLHT